LQLSYKAARPDEIGTHPNQLVLPTSPEAGFEDFPATPTLDLPQALPLPHRGNRKGGQPQGGNRKGCPYLVCGINSEAA